MHQTTIYTLNLTDDLEKEMVYRHNQNSDYEVSRLDIIKHDLVFNSYKEAYDFLEKEHGEDYPCCASVKCTQKVFSKELANKRKILLKKCKVAREKYVTKSNTDFFENRTSKKTNCKNCDSSINIDYITNNNCPVCGKSLLFEKEIDKIEPDMDKTVYMVLLTHHC